jgi:hypothetical protein
MPGDLFVMDSRVPVSPSTDKDDPSHPENVTKRAIMMERQAHADSEHDIKAPIRQAAAANYTKQPNLMYELVNVMNLNKLPTPYPPGLQEAVKAQKAYPSEANAQAVCSALPTCKAFVFTERMTFYYNKIGKTIPVGAAEGAVLYTKTTAEGFENPPPNLLLLLAAVLAGIVLIGIALYGRYSIYVRGALGVGAIYAFHYAASALPA